MTRFPPDADGYDGGLLPLESYVEFRQPLLEPHEANLPDYTDRILASKVLDLAWLREAGISVVLTPNGVDPNPATCPACLVRAGSAGGMQAWRPVGQPPSRARLESGAPASVVQDTGERVVVRLPANASGRLILSDTYYPGWSAAVDGRQAAVQPYDSYLRAVSIPPGAREVTFTYRPGWLTPGLLLSLASLLVTATLMASPLIATRRREGIGDEGH
jgi:Bacterial membrane protein YfhO